MFNVAAIALLMKITQNITRQPWEVKKNCSLWFINCRKMISNYHMDVKKTALVRTCDQFRWVQNRAKFRNLWSWKLSWLYSFTLKWIPSPLHEEFSIPIEFDDPCVAVTIRYKEVSSGHDGNSSWFAKMVIIIARHKGNSKSEQRSATSLRELQYLMQSNICHPYTVVHIHSKSMWEVESADIKYYQWDISENTQLLYCVPCF